MGALTILELTTARDNLIRALARGVLSVKDQSGEEVHYASPSAMQRALAILDSRIAQLQSGVVNRIRFCTKEN